MAIGDSLKQLRELELSDLDFNTIGVWPGPVKILLLIFLFALILVGGYFFHIKDLNLAFDRVKQKETQLRKQYEQKAFQVANLEAYRQQMVELEKSFGALLAQLPSDTEVPGLLEDITEIGYGSSMEIASITLQPEKAAEFYVELPIKIVARGGYHDFGSFVSGVAGLPRIVTLHDFKISKDRNGNLLAFEVLAKTYRYKAQDE